MDEKKVIVWSLELWKKLSMYELGMYHLAINHKKKENLKKYQHLIEHKPRGIS